jgi:hypothetical protein
MNGDDRGDHERRELPADPLQIEKTQRLHDQPSIAAAVTAGVNI